MLCTSEITDRSENKNSEPLESSLKKVLELQDLKKIKSSI